MQPQAARGRGNLARGGRMHNLRGRGRVQPGPPRDMARQAVAPELIQITINNDLVRAALAGCPVTLLGSIY